MNGALRILVLSDTHIPRVASDLPPQIYAEIEGVDMIFHAGDFVEKELLDKLKSLKETWGVYGNMDSHEVRRALKEKEVIQIGKMKIGLVHGHGAPGELADTVRSAFGKVNAIVYGHAHKPVNLVKDGILFFNPGSPTDKIFAKVNTYGILKVSDKKIEGKIVEIEH